MRRDLYQVQILIFILVKEEVFLRRIIRPYIFYTLVYLSFIIQFLDVLNNFQRGTRANCIIYQFVFGCRPGGIFKMRC